MDESLYVWYGLMEAQDWWQEWWEREDDDNDYSYADCKRRKPLVISRSQTKARTSGNFSRVS